MRITVVIPLYNKQATIQGALQSIFTQTVQPDEIIVVNDGSTDGSEKVVETINHPLIRLIHQPNSGVSAARNLGVREAKGDWIAFLDADDEWKPEFLETIMCLSASYPECYILATAYKLQDQHGNNKEISLNKMPFSGDHGILSNYFEVASCSNPPVWSSAVTIKKDAIISTGGFPVGVKSGEDLVAWARLASEFEIAYSIKPLSVFILAAAHTYDETPNRIPEEPDKVGNELAGLAKQNKDKRGIRKYVSHWYKMRSSIYLRLGMRKKALRSAILSILYNPLNFRVYIYLLLLFIPVTSVNLIFRKLGNS